MREESLGISCIPDVPRVRGIGRLISGIGNKTGGVLTVKEGAGGDFDVRHVGK